MSARGQLLRPRATAFRAAAILMLAALAARAPAGPRDGWRCRMEIAFPRGGSGDLTNFPALVVLSTNIPGFRYGDFASPGSGSDLRFSDAAGAALDHEIESWSNGGVSYAWVRVPLISGSNTLIHAYWGSSVALEPASTNGATWASGFVGVWHLAGPSPLDSTSNRLHAAGYGGVFARGTGVVDGAYSFDGADDYLMVTDSPALDFGTNDFTAEFMVRRRKATASWDNTWGMNKWKTGAEPGTNEWSLGLSGGVNDNRASFSVEIGTNNPIAAGAAAVSLNAWHHYAGLRAGTGIHVYVDGVLLRSTPAGTGAVNNVGRHMYVAGSALGTLNTDADFDEVRLSRVARSSNWLYACWLNQVSNALFVRAGAVERRTGPGASIQLR